MFTTKKKKIRRYLESIPDADKAGFDFLLLDYLNGILKSQLEDMGIAKINIHIDWHDHMKCIGVQGRFKKTIWICRSIRTSFVYHLIWMNRMKMKLILWKARIIFIKHWQIRSIT